MTQEKRPDMNEWEEQINALLDGELDDGQAEALKHAADSEPALARAIIEAYQLQRLMAQLPQERAPASLRRKLRRVPRERRSADRFALLQPRWALALAVVPLALALVIMQPREQRPSETELAQARQDLALALAYLQKASSVTGRKIQNTIDEGMSEPVAESTVRTLIENIDLNKETTT